jgi:xanthine dehydrogenase accessory factor
MTEAPVDDDVRRHPDTVVDTPYEKVVDASADVVLTDHHRGDLGPVLRDALDHPARWVGIIGSPATPSSHRRAGVAGRAGRADRPRPLTHRAENRVAHAGRDRHRHPGRPLADRTGRHGGFDF